SGISILIYTQDEHLRDIVQRNTSQGLDDASKYFFEPLGNGMVTIPLAIGFYAYGTIAKDQRAVRAGLGGIKAMAITAVFTYAIKYSTQRHRPYENSPPDPRMWEGPFGSYASTSFPSGHSTIAWAAATVFASEYKDKIWVPVISYTLATLASASRVYDDKHWSSDVVFGAALGFFIGKFVYKSTMQCPGLMIIPGVSASGHPGFTLSYRLQ
ncbi:MAG: phosphatase PAP2 family protein, partial [Bacteroidota bacterium]